MATRTLLTLEQFERLPDDGMRHELDEGALISLPPALGEHRIIQSGTAYLLTDFVKARSLGIVLIQTGFRLGPDTVQAPDVSFIRAEQAKKLDLESRFECAPDLAIEIISPSETAAEIAHKVRQYLHGGAVVWVFYPKDRTVHVFEPTKNARVLDESDLLELPACCLDFPFASASSSRAS